MRLTEVVRLHEWVRLSNCACQNTLAACVASAEPAHSVMMTTTCAVVAAGDERDGGAERGLIRRGRRARALRVGAGEQPPLGRRRPPADGGAGVAPASVHGRCPGQPLQFSMHTVMGPGSCNAIVIGIAQPGIPLPERAVHAVDTYCVRYKVHFHHQNIKTCRGMDLANIRMYRLCEQGSGNSSHNDGDSETASPSDDDYVQTAAGAEPDGPMAGRGHLRPGRAGSVGGKDGSAAGNGLATGASMDALSAELYRGSGTASVVPAMAGDPSPPLLAVPHTSLMPPLPPLAPATMTSSFAVSVGGGNRSVAARGQTRAAILGQNRNANGRGKKPHLKVLVRFGCCDADAPGPCCFTDGLTILWVVVGI